MSEEAAPCRGICESLDPIHLWFGLSYANYLVVQRSILQSMPLGWQRRFVGCLEELSQAAEGVKQPDQFDVKAVTSEGNPTDDPVPHYDRGRTKVPLRPIDVIHV